MFYFDAYHCSYSECWFRIAKESVLQGSSQTYKIIGCEGIELGQRMQVSEPGHLAFILYFEPVDKSGKMIDFKEGDNPGDFRITGIKFYKVPKPTGVIKCTLKGEVIDRKSSRLILMKEGEDPRIQKMIYITINNGKFEYVLNCDYEESYSLIFQDEWSNSMWRPVEFISEKGVINFTLHPMDKYDENKVEGGKLNEERLNFQIEERKMFESFAYTFNVREEQLEKDGNYYTPEAQLLIDKINAATDNNERRALNAQFQKLRNERLHITPAAKELMASGDSMTLVVFNRRLQYAREHTDIVGYSLLLSTIKDIVRDFKSDILPFMDVFNAVYAPKYPDHPYTTKMIDLLTGSSMKAGAPFIDFTAIDFTGKPVRLSERIAGKRAVLHLWASWCGPCRTHGKELIPV